MSIIRNLTAQPLADVFSSVNALFAGLAFGGVIITIYLQLGELKDTRRELQSTAQANQKMVRRQVRNLFLNCFRRIAASIFRLLRMIRKRFFFLVLSVKRTAIF